MGIEEICVCVLNVWLYVFVRSIYFICIRIYHCIRSVYICVCVSIFKGGPAFPLS